LAKGYDPRDFALTAFGGAGAIHAGALVEPLGIRTILVPKNTAPMLCALGDLLSDLRVSRVRSFYTRGSTVDLNSLNEICQRMRNEADDALGTQRSHLQGIETRLALEMRYVGQTHEVTVPISSSNGTVSPADMAAAIGGFHGPTNSYLRLTNRRMMLKFSASNSISSAYAPNPCCKPPRDKEQIHELRSKDSDQCIHRSHRISSTRTFMTGID
jgi:N-methylhydantoinase A/oxoprolinase/acetone carboxylase beta subunit